MSENRKRGQPPLPKGEAAIAVVTFRLTDDERAACERAAEAADKSFSDWARDEINKALPRHETPARVWCFWKYAGITLQIENMTHSQWERLQKMVALIEPQQKAHP